jgi:hypothetical protein
MSAFLPVVAKNNSLRSEGSSSAPVGIGDGSIEHQIQSTSTRQKSFSSGERLSWEKGYVSLLQHCWYLISRFRVTIGGP